MTRSVSIMGAVEGLIDQAVFQRLAVHVGAAPGAVYGRRGKYYIRDNMQAYNNAAQDIPCLVMVDLDEADCPAALRYDWLPRPGEFMCFRVAVHEIEAWLLADRERIAAFLGVPLSSIPENPEEEPMPKELIVELSAMSDKWDIVEDMVPRHGSHRKTGPAYNSRLVEFVQDRKRGWRPKAAAENSESLSRCIRCLEYIVTAYAAQRAGLSRTQKKKSRASDI